VSETEFLARQADAAKAAISTVTDEITRDVARTVDPRGWVQAAPWTTLAAAVLVGFAGTALVVPSKEEQTLRRLRKIEKALRTREARSHRRDGTHATNGEGDFDDAEDSADRDRSHPSFLGTLAGHAFSLLKPMITTAITAALSSKAAAEHATEQASSSQQPTDARPDIS
jgi:hypothetical protein